MNKLLARLFGLAFLALAPLTFFTFADQVLEKLQIPPSPVLTPEEALKSFKLAPGFRLELVASEPLVNDPVAISFDADGRIWACEMRGYMPNVEGKGEKEPVGQIVVLEDTDGDGKMDKSTIFLDKLVLPRAVCWTSEGVLVAENAKLWMCRDTKGTGKCDEKTFICDYGGGPNPEYGGNGLLPALDNWIYNAGQGVRLRKIQGAWVKESTIGRGQWGIAMDDLGRLYYNSNSSLLRGDLVPCYSPNAHAAGAMTNVQLYKEQDVWPARVTPGVNRGYYNLRPDGTLKSVTAACGPCIFRGDNLPEEVQGNAFICEPAANLVRQNVFFQEKGKLTSRNAYVRAEFLASTDERFRPVNLNNGPDGALYVVDFYRGILQHKTYMTPFLRKQVLERGLDRPLGLGRIYRVVHDKSTPRQPVKMSVMKNEELVAHLSDANGWRRDMVQRLLVERGDVSVVPAVEKLVLSGAQPLGRLHGLWVLEGLNALDPETLAEVMADKDASVRASAVFMARRYLRTNPNPDLLREVVRLGKDPSQDVRLQLVFTLGLLPGETADAALVPMLKAAGEDNSLLDAVLTGFAGRESEFLSARLEQPGWTKQELWREKLLKAAAGHMWKQRNPLNILRFLHVVGTQPQEKSWLQLAMLEGLQTVPNKKDKSTPKPLTLPKQPEALEKLRQASDTKIAQAAEVVAKQLNWPGKDGKPLPVPPPLSPQHQTLVELGRKEYLLLCANCHHPEGYGEAGKAPALLDSDWLRGSEERLVRLVLHGMRGPINLNKEVYNRDSSQEMPGMGMALDDQKIAAILTYVRREWGEFAPPVEPAMVEKIRAATRDRTEQWTEKELLKVK